MISFKNNLNRSEIQYRFVKLPIDPGVLYFMPILVPLDEIGLFYNSIGGAKPTNQKQYLMDTNQNLFQEADEKYSNVTERFSIILKQLRDENDLTQQELYERSGVSLRMISDMENGRKQPTLITLFKLAKGFDIGINVLLERLLKELGES